MPTFLAIIGTLLGLCATLFLITLYLAGAANMSGDRLKSHYRQLKLVAVFLLFATAHVTAASYVGVTPAVFAIIFLVIALWR